ncbi:hypothetical protein AAVH_23936 [Aphelenchoides avenae]|nr:hypothetical protein AAVH_23936 [Aphelenchus avenae]
MRRGAKQRIGPRRHPPALGFELESCLLESKPLRPSIRDLHITAMITLRKTQLKYPPSDNDRQNLGIFEHQGLLYVKGRLGNMKLRPTALTPIYLPRQAPETKFIILEYHRINGHAGAANTLANLRMRYWFTHGRRTIQSAIHKHCFACRREALHPCSTAPWPQLPLSRVSKTRPFYHTGLDFFGPVYLRVPKDSGGYYVAKYSVAIFTCMTFRCVHLELCPDLSTQSFLDAFQRFGSRREFPARILSDNGLSFITAREVIKQIKRSHAPPQPVKRRNPVRRAISARLAVRRKTSHSDVPTPSTAHQPTPPHTTPQQHRLAVPHADLTPEEELVTDFCQRNNIEWQTITELSPWRGGSYERLIGIVKQSLRRSIGKSKPTLEQYQTLLAVAERTANCRPLTYVAESNDDFYLVRPIDFIHPLLRDEYQQDPLDPPTDSARAQDDPDFVAPGENRLHAKLLRDLGRARELADAFWIQFRDGVLLELRNRGINSKRRQLGQNTIEPGDLVLVKEEGLPRTDWRLALVLQLLPSADGLIRSAKIRFARTHEETNRALEHLYPIGQAPQDTTSCPAVAVADVHSIFFISEIDVTMDNRPSNAQPKPIDAEMIRQALADPRRRQALEQLLLPNSEPLSESKPSHTDGNDKDREEVPMAEPANQTEAPAAPSESVPSHTDGKDKDSGAEKPIPSIMDLTGPSTAAAHYQLLNNIAARMHQDDKRPKVVFILPGRHKSTSAEQHLTQLKTTPEVADASITQRNAVPDAPAFAAVPRADHKDDQEKSEAEPRNTDCKRSEPSHTGGEEAAAQKTTDCKRPEPSHNDGEGNAANSKQPAETQDPVQTNWEKIQADHAASVALRRQRLMEAAAKRQQKPSVSATAPPAPSKPATETHEEVLAALATAEAENRWIPASTSEWALEQRRIAAARNEERWRQRFPHTVTDDDERLDNNPALTGQRLGAKAAFEADPLLLTRSIHPTPPTSATTASAAPAPPPPAGTSIELFATSHFVDWAKLPKHLSMDEIWYRTCQFFSFEQDADGNQLDKIDQETLKSLSMRFPKEDFFWIQNNEFVKDDSTWQPKNNCPGTDEPSGFHVSVGATLIIIKNRWRQYKQIAASQELLTMLNTLMRLHIRNFGQMILLVYAARLAGDHNRMESILRFIDAVLRARDLDYDTARAIQRHVPKMVLGVDAKKNPYPYEEDFKVAAERWCNCCYKAFVYIYERLSGPIAWTPEWLMSKEIPKDFRDAINKIIINAAAILLNLKERIYKRYVLRRIKALEDGATTFDCTPLPIGIEERRLDWPDELRSHTSKYLLLVDEENDYLFCDELHKADVTIVVMPSTNREDVLRFVRNIMPGRDTQRIYFWFGREYIRNGNTDFGCLITELCHHYTAFFSRINQYVVLPPYTRLKPDAWTFDVLCL